MIFQIDRFNPKSKTIRSFGDYSDWLLLENKNQKRLSDYTSFLNTLPQTTRQQIIEFVKLLTISILNFYDELQKDNTNVLQIEFIKLFSWSFDDTLQ